MPRQNSLARFIYTPENRSALHAIKELLAALLRGKEPPANPLYIHGPTGTGKTCLVESLAAELAAQRRDLTIRTTSAADVRETQPEDIWDCDVLILEDIQRL